VIEDIPDFGVSCLIPTVRARRNIYYPDVAQTQIDKIEGTAYGLKELCEKSCHNDQLPQYVKTGTKMRLTALDTLPDTCEAIMSQHDM